MARSETNSRNSILYGSIYSILGGVGLQTLAPMFTDGAAPYTTLLKVAGVVGIGYYAWTYSKYDKIFKNLGFGFPSCYPVQVKAEREKFSTIYKFTLPPGKDIKELKNNKDALEQFTGKKISIEYINRGLFIIEEFHNTSQPFFDYEPIKLHGRIPIYIGRDRHGNEIWFELADVQPHLLIAGTTGSGKSSAIRVILTNLILMTNVILHLTDLKNGAELAVFRNSSHVKSFATTLKEAAQIILNLIKEAERRYRLFTKNGVVDIYEYNAKFKKDQLPYELFVVDEMSDFEGEKDLLHWLTVLSSKARSCGLHLLFSTQRPDKDILTGKIKANVTNVLGLYAKNVCNSKIIMDEAGLEKLLGKGDGLFFHAGKTIPVQTPLLTNEDAKALIKHTYIDKTDRTEYMDVEEVDSNLFDKFDAAEVFNKWQ